jgi:CRP-like cAMP-binding protein
VGRFAVGHRANHAQLVGESRGLGQRVAKQHARNLGLHHAHFAAVLDRRVRLGVERFLVSHATGQEDMNDRLGGPFEVRVALLLGSRFAPQQVGERQAAKPGQGTNRQEIPPADRAEMGGVIVPGPSDRTANLFHGSFSSVGGEYRLKKGKRVVRDAQKVETVSGKQAVPVKKFRGRAPASVPTGEASAGCNAAGSQPGGTRNLTAGA